MSINKGKIFEDDFKKSCKKQKIFCRRLRDNPASFEQGNNTKFSHKQPYDFEIFRPDYDFLNLGLNDEIRPIGRLYCIELKSTKQPSISIQISENDADGMIHYHQIVGLTDAKKYKGVEAGFLLNYRKDEKSYTVYIDIDDFNKYIYSTGKKSIGFKSALIYGGIPVKENLLRTHYDYDINKLINDIIQKEAS